MKRLFCILALCLTFMPSPKAGAQVAAATIATFLSGLSDLANEIEEGASSLITQGNLAAAQQQMLFAGILKGTISQIETAYADSLDRTIEGLSVVDQNAFTNLQAQIESVEGVIDAGAEDAYEAIYRAQGAANQLLDRLPLADRYPVFYGMTVGDLAPEEGENPADIKILGFLLSDPKLERKPPVISVGGTEIAQENISTREDRIHVQIPQELKESLGVDNEACNPRRTFPISITTFYAKKRGWFWPFTWSEEQSVDFRGNALASPDRYDLEVAYSGTRTTRTWEERTFRTEKQYRNVGCENENSASATFQAPAGARRLQCTAHWTDQSNLKKQNADCPRGGTTATGTGTIRGRDRDFFGNCPGGGHAYFQIFGTYEMPLDTTATIAPDPQDFVSEAPLDFNATLGIPNDLTDVSVGVVIRRHQCDQELDRIDIPGVRPELRTEQTSRNGRFSATLQNGLIAVTE